MKETFNPKITNGMPDKMYYVKGLIEVQMYTHCTVMFWKKVNLMGYMGIHKRNPMWFCLKHTSKHLS